MDTGTGKKGKASDANRRLEHQTGFDFKTSLSGLERVSKLAHHSNYRFNIAVKTARPSKPGESKMGGSSEVQFKSKTPDLAAGQPSYQFSSRKSGCYLPINRKEPDELRPEINHTLSPSPIVSIKTNLLATDSCHLDHPRAQLEKRLLHICTSLFTKPKRPGKDIDAVLALADFSQKEPPGEFQTHLCDIATNSRLHSKTVQSYLKNIPSEQARLLVAGFGLQIRKLIWNEFGHHVLRSSILLSPALADDCQRFCQANFSRVARSSHSVSVAKKLANLKPDFCEFGLNFFRDHLQTSVSDPSALLLLSSLITNAPREDLLEFLFPALEQSLGESKTDCPLVRVLSILIDRLADRSLIERAARVCLPHIEWMVDDPIGNYAIQSFIRKDSPTIVVKLQKLCLLQPELLITNKYRRYILLGLLGAGGQEAFIAKALLGMTAIPQTKEVVYAMLANRRNIFLFFFALLATEGFDRASFEQVCSKTQEWANSDSRTSCSPEWRRLSLMVDCLSREDFSTILGLLSRMTAAG